MIKKAEKFARSVHKDQLRKGGGGAYITHPKRVAEILTSWGVDESVIAAGWLHDTVEDTPTTIEDIQSEFGNRVANYVTAVTEDKSIKNWHERKSLALNKVLAANPIVSVLKLADFLSNLEDLSTLIENEGATEAFSHFRQGKKIKSNHMNHVRLELLKRISNKEPMYTDVHCAWERFLKLLENENG